jgi:hypothetical protein
MLMMKERRPAFRTIEGWARSVLIEAGAIRECEEHGWMRDRADPHARERALLVARRDPPPGVSPLFGIGRGRVERDGTGDERKAKEAFPVGAGAMDGNSGNDRIQDERGVLVPTTPPRCGMPS